MRAEREWADPEIPQDPGIPGSKSPEQLPPDDAPEVADVPESPQPDVDDAGHQAPPDDER